MYEAPIDGLGRRLIVQQCRLHRFLQLSERIQG